MQLRLDVTNRDNTVTGKREQTGKVHISVTFTTAPVIPEVQVTTDPKATDGTVTLPHNDAKLSLTAEIVNEEGVDTDNVTYRWKEDVVALKEKGKPAVDTAEQYWGYSLCSTSSANVVLNTVSNIQFTKKDTHTPTWLDDNFWATYESVTFKVWCEATNEDTSKATTSVTGTSNAIYVTIELGVEKPELPTTLTDMYVDAGSLTLDATPTNESKLGTLSYKWEFQDSSGAWVEPSHPSTDPAKFIGTAHELGKTLYAKVTVTNTASGGKTAVTTKGFTVRTRGVKLELPDTMPTAYKDTRFEVPLTVQWFGEEITATNVSWPTVPTGYGWSGSLYGGYKLVSDNPTVLSDAALTVTVTYGEKTYTDTVKLNITVQDAPAGFTVTGTVKSYGSATEAVTVTLTKSGETTAAYTETLTGATGTTPYTQTYSFTTVPAGTYTLTVTKKIM